MADVDAAPDEVVSRDVARAPRRRVRWWWLPIAVVVVGAAYFSVTLLQVVRAGRSDEAAPADAIVVLGAAQYDGRPSAQLAARLDHAGDLWDDGVAPIVMVTGGKQPGDRFTEAEASQRHLVARGVPESAIMLENDGTTTYESLEGAAESLRAIGADEVVLVTDPYHAYRAELIARDVGLDAMSSPTPFSVVHGWTSARRHLAEAGGVAVGRIVGFDRLSDWTG